MRGKTLCRGDAKRARSQASMRPPQNAGENTAIATPRETGVAKGGCERCECTTGCGLFHDRSAPRYRF